jgi:hypothetical protein
MAGSYGRRGAGRRPAAQLEKDIAAVRLQAAGRGELISDRAACMRIPNLPAYRKQYSGLSWEALYKRLRRTRRPHG